MDRGTKLMFGAMTVAICLMAFNMVGGKSPEANASMNAGYDYRGGTEPTIVSFRVTPLSARNFLSIGSNGGAGAAPTAYVLLTRMWSDGAVEINVVGSETIHDTSPPAGRGTRDRGNRVPSTDYHDLMLMNQAALFEGWILVQDSVAGYRCSADTNGDRVVGADDVLAVIDQYGPCEGEPPLGIPMDMDP
jgi:hypothetical protein